MAGEWTTLRLGNLCSKIGSGATPRGGNSVYLSEGKVTLIRSQNVYNDGFHREGLVYLTEEHAAELANVEVAENDVLLNITGDSVARACQVDPDILPARVNQHVAIIRPDPSKLSPMFLRYFLVSPAMQAEMLSFAGAGATRNALTKGMIEDFEIAAPSEVREQRAIAHILGTLDDKIELNRRVNETLEAMARALFKSWFVDFDPVRAKAERRDPGLPKDIANLFPDRFEDSELGEIPKGWKVKAIEAIAKRVGMGPFGSSIKVETFVPEGVPVISGQHLDSFMVEDNTFNFVAHEHAERLRTANVQRGDVVFTHAGNIGQVAYIPENSRYDRYVISQRQFFMRCDLAQVTPSFVAFYFGSPEGQHRLLANASSSGVPSIARPVTYLRSIQLTIPPKPVMDAFEKSVQPLLTQFRRNLNEVSTLASLRDTLLPKLISGELRVKQMEPEAA